MITFWKGLTALGLAAATIGITATPAQAQHHRGYGYGGGYDGHRDGWRGDRRRWDGRRWDRRGDWRGHQRYARSHYRHRARCWSEWRYDHYRDRDVRVRICR